MMRFTDSPYEKMMQQVPTERGRSTDLPPSAHSPLPRLSLPPDRALPGNLLPEIDERKW